MTLEMSQANGGARATLQSCIIIIIMKMLLLVKIRLPKKLLEILQLQFGSLVNHKSWVRSLVNVNLDGRWRV